MSLEHFVKIIYKTFTNTDANISFTYWVITHNVVYFSDAPHELEHQHRYKEMAILSLAEYQPIVLYTNAIQYQWHIKTTPYERLQLVFKVLRRVNHHDRMVVYEGSSSVSKDLCILDNILIAIVENNTIESKAFQLFLVLSSNSKAIVNYSMIYQRLLNLQNLTEIDVTMSGMTLSLPENICIFTSPVFLCQMQIEARDVHFVRGEIQQLSLSAPDDPACNFAGLSWTNIPHHIVAEWVHTTNVITYRPNDKIMPNYESQSGIKYMDVMNQVYTQHTMCDDVTSDIESAMPYIFHSSSHKVLLTFYAYVPFVLTKFIVVVYIESTKIQKASLNIFVESKLLLYTKETDDIMVDTVDVCLATYDTMMKSPYIISQLKFDFLAMSKVISRMKVDAKVRVVSNFFHYENYIHCTMEDIFVQWGMYVSLINLKTNEASYISSFPLYSKPVMIVFIANNFQGHIHLELAEVFNESCFNAWQNESCLSGVISFADRFWVSDFDKRFYKSILVIHHVNYFLHWSVLCWSKETIVVKKHCVRFISSLFWINYIIQYIF